MKNEITIFKNENFGEIRTIKQDEEIWFVGKDVASVLGYKETANMRKIIDVLDYKEINPQNLETTGFVQNGITLEPNKNIQRMLLINESGLYQAIFNSTLSKAKEFKRWVTSEVLPEIRKTGSYIVDDEKARINAIQKGITNATSIETLELIQDLINGQKALIEENTQQKEIIQIQALKVEFYDDLVDSKTLLSIRDGAKTLKIKERVFVKTLIDKKYLYKDKYNQLRPYSQYMKTIFQLKYYQNKLGFKGVQTMITTNGIKELRKVFK